jgi:hypothetical protein
MTTRWRCTVRLKDRTPPFNAHPPYELRALSEESALDLIAHWRPDLEVLTIERMASTPSSPPAS